MAILITGATGFLGNKLVEKYLSENKHSDFADKLILLGHSEKRADSLRRRYNIPVLVGDISSKFYLEKIFEKNNIRQVIHSAAIKYVSISNENPITTVETNLIGSYNLIKLCKKYGVAEMVGISTDKAVNPSNLYGMSKRIMELMFIESGYTIVSGVNFFGSSGSVLDIWKQQFLEKLPLTITDPNCFRYFIEIDDMVSLVLDSLGKSGIYSPEYTYRIRMKDLLSAFMDVFDYHDYKITGLLEGEKLEEEIDSQIKFTNADGNFLRDLIKKWDVNFTN